MRLFVEERHDGIRVWCSGFLDAAGCRSLQIALNSLRGHGRPVVVDVGGITSTDVVAATSLAHHVRRLREAGLPTVLAAVDLELRETFELIGCADVLSRDALDASSGPS